MFDIQEFDHIKSLVKNFDFSKVRCENPILFEKFYFNSWTLKLFKKIPLKIFSLRSRWMEIETYKSWRNTHDIIYNVIRVNWHGSAANELWKMLRTPFIFIINHITLIFVHYFNGKTFNDSTFFLNDFKFQRVKNLLQGSWEHLV